MAATLELKYFNTFWLKKVASITAQDPAPAINAQYGNTTYPGVPQDYAADNAKDWYIEEARIRGGYNNTITDLGVKAYVVEDNPNQQHLFSSLIYPAMYKFFPEIISLKESAGSSDLEQLKKTVSRMMRNLCITLDFLIIFHIRFVGWWLFKIWFY